MEIYIIRHGIAHPLGSKNGFIDEDRTLTAQGRERTREIARGLRKLGVRLDLIMTSPLARAAETAEIVAEVLGLSELVLQTQNLAPGGLIEDLFAEIKEQRIHGAVALVGHEPGLGYMGGRLVCGDSHASLPLKKGGVCCIEITETIPAFRGNLLWLSTPKQLRLLGKG